MRTPIPIETPDFQDEEPTVIVPVESLAETMATLPTSERPTVRLRAITEKGETKRQ